MSTATVCARPVRCRQISAAASPAAAIVVCAAAPTRNEEGSAGSAPVSVTRAERRRHRRRPRTTGRPGFARAMRCQCGLRSCAQDSTRTRVGQRWRSSRRACPQGRVPVSRLGPDIALTRNSGMTQPSALSRRARGLLQEGRHVIAEADGRRPAVFPAAVGRAWRTRLPGLARRLCLPRLLRRLALRARSGRAGFSPRWGLRSPRG